MWLASYVSLGILAVLWGLTLLRRRIGGGSFLLFWSPVLLMAAVLFWTTRQQFLLWQVDELSRYLIPPYRSINYFLFYSLTRFWASYLVSLAVALIFLWLARHFNKIYQERFFWPEEPYFLALGIFLVSHPGWILYLILTPVAYLLVAIGYTLVAKKMERISFYYVWLPLAAAVIILNPWLLQFEFYKNLII